MFEKVKHCVPVRSRWHFKEEEFTEYRHQAIAPDDSEARQYSVGAQNHR